MPFYLLANESVEDRINRIVSEEIAQAIKEVDNPRLKRSEAIHEVRKHCKKIRISQQIRQKTGYPGAAGLIDRRSAELRVEAKTIGARICLIRGVWRRISGEG